MASLRYTVEELLHLSQSPLAVRPDDLPNIEQWFEPISQNKNRNSAAARPDENDNPKQRNLSQVAGLGSTRFTARKDGEEVFLGPKMSFASASAARQANKTSHQDGDELRKFDRFAPREKDALRDRDGRSGEGRRDRLRETNGTDADGKTRFGRNKLSVDEDEERGNKFKTRAAGGREEDPKRAGRGAGRAKFDQPWFRDATKDAPAEEASEAKGAWREEKPRRAADKEWGRKLKPDDDPGWELSGQTSEPAARTIDDFQKWKERMKAGDSAAPRADGVAVAAEAQPAEKPKAMMPAAFFGNLGAPDDAPAEVTTPKAAGTKKSGKSRFQSFFGANEELEQLGLPLPEQTDQPQQQSRQAQLPSPSQPQHQPQSQSQPQSQPQAQPQNQPQSQPATTNSEDQAGFERMMAMLRMGGAGSQGPGPRLFASPPPASQKQQRAPSGPPPGLPAFFDSGPASPPASAVAATLPPPAPTPPSQTNTRPQPLPTPDRNSEFLLNLMKSQQPRTPFTEGQIYGQGYERKTPDAASARYPPPPGPQSRGQPSRFFNNEQAFASNGGADRGLASAAQSPQRNDDSMRYAKEQPPVPPGFDQPHHMFGGRPPSPQRMPPPGFPQRPPPPASQHIPPGFFNGAPQYPPHLVGQQPGGGPMRGPMQPPGFFHAPPGFPNLPPGMHHGPPPGQRRSGGIPPGFDVFAGGPGPNGRQVMGAGGPPPPSAQQGHMQNQGGYAQYAQQMGAGSYKGVS